MANLKVDPTTLTGLAKIQDDAAKQAGTAAEAASTLETQVWMSHGVISAASNISFTEAEAARRAAGEAIQKSCGQLAEKLNTAAAVYTGTDEQAASNLDRQVLDR
ncbi:type VII secretion target [Mycobacterium sp. 050134]|uniref:type VII secretion target n=1 Tax=Mycobacterium sp. 050134 TaxID=3096111 RepID=UPI002EDAE9AF